MRAFSVLSIAIAIAVLVCNTGGCKKEEPLPQQLPKVECRMLNSPNEMQVMFQWKYDLGRQAIIDVLKQNGGTMLFNDLRKAAKRTFSLEEQGTLGNLNWVVETVALEMEVRGELRRKPKSDSRFPIEVTLIVKK